MVDNESVRSIGTEVPLMVTSPARSWDAMPRRASTEEEELDSPIAAGSSRCLVLEGRAGAVESKT